MNIKLYSPDSFQTVPWRNGLGSTIELLSEQVPDSEEFGWRLSMADVVNDGRFSDFSGYDRTLILLEGTGITLDHNNGVIDVLDEPFQVSRFKGDERTEATLHDGPITDFNIMSRRSYCHTCVDIIKNADNLKLSTDSDILLIYAVDTAIDVSIDSSDPLLVGGEHLLEINNPRDKICSVSGAVMVVIQVHYNK